jgi:hypothetical protein
MLERLELIASSKELSELPQESMRTKIFYFSFSFFSPLLFIEQ